MCPACYTKHDNQADLDAHLLVHLWHYEDPEKSEEVICPKFEPEAEETQLQSCSQCEFKTRLSFALNRHVKIKQISTKTATQEKFCVMATIV